MRLFLAIDMNEDIKEHVKKIQAGLQSRDFDVKFVEPHNLHITLKFLGDVPEEAVKGLEQDICEALDAQESFEMGFAEIGYFGSPRFPRIIWAGIKTGRSQLLHMMKNLHVKLDYLRCEDKEPAPHLTIARVRSPRNAEKLVHEIEASKDTELGSMKVDEVKLMKSDLTPKGPVYTEIKSFILKGQIKA